MGGAPSPTILRHVVPDLVSLVLVQQSTLRCVQCTLVTSAQVRHLRQSILRYIHATVNSVSRPQLTRQQNFKNIFLWKPRECRYLHCTAACQQLVACCRGSRVGGCGQTCLGQAGKTSRSRGPAPAMPTPTDCLTSCQKRSCTAARPRNGSDGRMGLAQAGCIKAEA